MNGEYGVSLHGVRFAYSDKAPELAFDCNFKRGVTTAIMGASGAGKSTMLSLIAGFERVKTGKIFIEGDDCTSLPPAERPLSMIFQEHNLFAHMSVFRNVALGISPSLSLTDADRDMVKEALSNVGLKGYDDRLPAQLSGGERQRVALARVLVRRKPVLLLDEAFASLGPGLRADMLELVSELSKANGMTTLMVTHSPEDALRIAQNLLFLGESGIAFDGSVRELDKSKHQNALIAEYLGEQMQDKN